MTLLCFYIVKCQNKLEIFDYSKVQWNKADKRDSLYVTYSLYKWHDVHLSLLTNLKRVYGCENTDIQIELVNTFYSPDKKKAIFWINEKQPYYDLIKQSDDSNKWVITNDHVYFSYSVIGIRDDTNSVFRLMLFEQQFGEVRGDEYKEYYKECLSEFFYKNMKNKTTSVYFPFLNSYYGGDTSARDFSFKMISFNQIWKEYGFNIQDSAFWERNLIWQKGVRVPDYYIFEVITPANPDYIEFYKNTAFKDRWKETYPQIDYPDSILKMYNNLN